MVAVKWLQASSLTVLSLVCTRSFASATSLDLKVPSTPTLSQIPHDSHQEPATLNQSATRTQPAPLARRENSNIPDKNPDKDKTIWGSLGNDFYPLGGKKEAVINGGPANGRGWVGDDAPLPTQTCYVQNCGEGRCDIGWKEYRIWGKDWRIRPDGEDPISNENSLIETLKRRCKVEHFFGFYWMGPDGSSYDRHQWMVQFKWAPYSTDLIWNIEHKHDPCINDNCITEAILMSGGRIGQTNEQMNLVSEPDICHGPVGERDEVKMSWWPWEPWHEPTSVAPSNKPRAVEFTRATATASVVGGNSTLLTTTRGRSEMRPLVATF